MNTIWIIIQREYITRVRKKSFIITTILAPLGLVAFAVFTVFIAGYSSSHKQVAIVDQSGLFGSLAFADADDGSVMFHKEQDTTGILTSPKDATARYDALVVIPAHYDLSNPLRVKIDCISDKNIGLSTRAFIDKSFTDKIRLLRAEQLHLSSEQLQDLQQDIPLKYENLHADVRKALTAEIGAGLGYVMGMIIYVLLLVYGSMIMKGVAEEKSSRIMEVLISSVKPIQLMVGKIVGVGAVGLTQFVLWILLSAMTMLLLPMLGLKAGNMQQMSRAGGSMQGADFDPDTVQQYIGALHDFHFAPLAIVLLLFFIGGFLLYGSLFAAIGAAGADEANAQSLTFPVMLPVIFSILLLSNVLTQPEGRVAFISSIVPFSSPIIMPALMPASPPIWHILLSLSMLILGFLLSVALAAKIYRTGILMYGKKVTFGEIIKWVVAKK
jgi:ABC-2 type transport system permease protein